MKPRLLDTQKAQELGPDGTSALQGSWAVNTYTLTEFEKHGIDIFPTDTTLFEGSSWPDFAVKFNTPDYKWWELETSGTIWRIQYFRWGFGIAPCGHTATIQINEMDGSSCFKLCDRFLASNADMANFIDVLGERASYPYTADRCLGKACKVCQEMKDTDSTS